MRIVEEDRRFIALDENSNLISELTFSRAGEKLWIIDFVYVSEAYRGQSVGRRMMDFVTETAREQGVKILPLCPYAKHEANKNQEKYSDVLHKP